MSGTDQTAAITPSNKLLCVVLWIAIVLQYAQRTSVSVVLVKLQMPTEDQTSTDTAQKMAQYSQFQVGQILSSVYIGLVPATYIGGHLAHRYPPMRVLLGSLGTSAVLHSVAPFLFRHFESAVVQRVVAGLAEGPCEPAACAVLAEYLLPTQGARIAPYIFSGLRLGEFLGVIATGFITTRPNWQAAFYIFGCLGVVSTALLFGLYAGGVVEPRDDTGASKQDEAETKKINESIPFLAIVTSPAVLAYILLNMVSYAWDASILPLYFKQSFGAHIEMVGVLAGLPVLIFGVLEPTFAWVGNTLTKYLSTTVVRKAMAVFGCVGMWVCLLVAYFTSNPALAASFVITAYGLSAARAAVTNANAFDIAPRYIGVVNGIGRALSRVVGVTFPLMITALTPNKSKQEWSHVLLIIAYVFGGTAVFYGVFGSGEEQPWAAGPPQGQHGGRQDGDKQDGKTLSKLQ